MKKALWLVLISAAINPSVNTHSQPMPQVGPRNYSVLDLTFSKAGEVDYVDGVRVPADVGLLNFLRQQDKTSPRTGLLVFVPVTTTLRTITDLRVIAGKIQYEYLRIYVYDDRYRNSVTEILFGPDTNSRDVRMGPHGPVPWPEFQNPEK